MKHLIYLVSLFVMISGMVTGYYAGFVSPESVPLAKDIFFADQSSSLSFLSPFICFVFYALVGNGLAFILIAVLGKLTGYSIIAEGIGGISMGVSLGKRTKRNKHEY